MAVHRCPKCSLPCLDAEFEKGVCPGCKTPFHLSAQSPLGDGLMLAPAAQPMPGRAAPFLLGLFLGCLLGSVALWAVWRLGAVLLGGEVEHSAAFEAVQAQKAAADNLARESENRRQAAEAGHATARKALDAASRQTAALLKQKEDAEQRLAEALAHLSEERGQRVALEKALAEQNKARLAPKFSFVRDWQLLGPFASTGEHGHDTVYPPEREPLQLEKPYAGAGGPVKWRAYHSPEDKIDLASFFDFREAGVAYAVTWAYAEEDQFVTLGIGSDDGIRVWVNGDRVHDVKGGRQARPGQDMVKVQLKTGWNEIRAKVDNILGTWELYLEFRTADGGRPFKIVSTNSPPSALPR